MAFDYGNKLPDRQFERHPVKTGTNFVAPIRNSYIHDKCNGKTFFGDAIAETYAQDPKYYTKTYCSACQSYFPILEFKWAVDGVRLGELGGVAGKDLMERWAYSSF